jgi:hypothetical protein
MGTTLAWPVHIVDGEYATVEIGGIDEAVQNVAVLSQTRPGERVAMLRQARDFGVPDPVGQRGLDPQPLIDQAQRWIPGVQVAAERLPADRREFDQVVTVTR